MRDFKDAVSEMARLEHCGNNGVAPGFPECSSERLMRLYSVPWEAQGPSRYSHALYRCTEQHSIFSESALGFAT